MKVSPYLKEENDTVALEWLNKRVQPLFTTRKVTEIENTNNGCILVTWMMFYLILFFISILLK